MKKINADGVQSVKLTRLPSLSQPGAVSSTKGSEKAEPKVKVEYSSREVSPPALLLEQLQQAHHLFCLHHGPSLSDLWVRLSRDKFCSTLERFWTRFSRSWDVLLHGNPAADIFSGLKVSSGGELGFGVGEEEWGSGERDVLEDLTRRTDGLVDLVVSRFGEPKPKDKDDPTVPETEALPWMGSGREPTASDGVIFGGVGALERHSLRDVSLWMRQIYTNGDYAYGIRDNPQRERRKRRRPNPPAIGRATNGTIDKKRDSSRNADKTNTRKQVQTISKAKQIESNGATNLDLPKDPRPEIHHRVASRDLATTPQDTTTPQPDTPHANVPPPVASAVEQALNKATKQADLDAEQEDRAHQDATDEEEAATTLGIPDQYMKYLTFGLSTLGKPAPKKRPPTPRSASAAASTRPSAPKDKAPTPAETIDEDEEIPAMMTHLQPMPDGESLMSKIVVQKRLENEGYFVVGLQGDINASTGDSDADATDGSFGNDNGGSRIVLRTVQVELAHKPADDGGDEQTVRRPSLARQASGSELCKGFRRLRVIIYARRPFVYCFLFEASTSSLQYNSFYRTLRQNLMPIHKPLLSSTSAKKVAERIDNSHLDPTPSQSETASVTSRSSKNTLPSKTPSPAPIFDLIYDPRLLTVHTSIPNIPEPGTPAAEGIFSAIKTELSVPGWTRIEAMNVHSQVLNTLASVKKRKTEIERTSKTGRGWWVVWMKVPPSGQPAEASQPTESAENEEGDRSLQTITSTSTATPIPAAPPAATEPAVEDTEDLSRIAFLVRRATDAPPPAGASSSGMSSRFALSASNSRAVSNMFNNMTFGLAGGRSEEEVTGGSGAGWGPQALAGGMGVDARRYVEGLLSLGR